jgi:hypothetical protein
MSVITFPRSTSRPIRRETPPSKVTTTAPGRTKSRHRRPISRRWTALAPSGRAAIIGAVAMFVVLVGNTYTAQRQIELHNLQAQLLQAQSSYAQQVSDYTNIAAPGRVATDAGNLHLVEPTSVTQIASVPLTTPLALPTFTSKVKPISRIIP